MNTEKKQNGLGIAGMILGIVAVVTSCFVLGGLFGTIGLILSIIALTNKNKKKGMAIAGIILNIIGIAIAMAVLISSVINNQSVAPSSISNEASVSTSTDEESTFDITEGYATMDKFNQIEIGMTYDQVVDIVGSEGTLMSEAGTGEYKVSIYYWYSVTHIANMNVSFEKALLMQNDLNIAGSEVISTYVYKVGLQSGIGDFSLSTAIGMFNSVINFILLVIVNGISKRLTNDSIF